jgi:hypothetical protein
VSRKSVTRPPAVAPPMKALGQTGEVEKLGPAQIRAVAQYPNHGRPGPSVEQLVTKPSLEAVVDEVPR